MKYSNATNYALHTMVCLAVVPTGKTIGVRPLAEAQRVSSTYLSKILTKLVKAGFVESTPGVNGGYRLLKSVKNISFFDVIQAVEGSASLFTCHLDNDFHLNNACLIQKVMEKAEKKMNNYLQKQNISDLIKKIEPNIIEVMQTEAH